MKKPMTATEGKNNFGGLLEAVATCGAVETVKHGRPVAVVSSPRAFESASAARSRSASPEWGATHMIPPARARAARITRLPASFDE